MSRSLMRALFGFLLISVPFAVGQEPAKPAARARIDEDLMPPVPAPSKPRTVRESKTIPTSPDEIKPLPLVAIPDDPPPHEGAMIDLPLTIDPPDILEIEVVETLPGLPITGEHLVRPDGTVSLGFYGAVHVRGLTIEQAKIKIILHLRKYMNDDVLGLTTINLEVNPVEPPPPKLEGPKPEVLRKVEVPAVPSAQPVPPEPSEKPKQPQKPDAVAPKEAMLPEGLPLDGGRIVLVHPADSVRVFVNIVAHNNKVYYVQGDVGVPGRLPCTGHDTVLDALNYAGGMIPSAEPADIHLYRPGRGGKPAKDYRIDHPAILRGVNTANLQVFPGDRLVIGRNPIVKKTIEIDRAVAPIASIFNSLFHESVTMRYLGPASGSAKTETQGVTVKMNGQNIPVNPADAPVLSPEQRDALVKKYVEFLWEISSKEGGAMLDEAKFREALMKRLNTTSPVPEAK